MKQSDTGFVEYLNEEADKIKKHGCIVPRVEMGTKDFLKTIEIINRQKAEINILIRKHNTLLDEIAEKDAEIERQKEYCLKCAERTTKAMIGLQETLGTARIEAIKEFAKRLRLAMGKFSVKEYWEVSRCISNLVKEMTEEQS